MDAPAVSSHSPDDKLMLVEPPAPQPDKKSLRRVLSGGAVAVGLLLLKLKALVFPLIAKFRILLVNPFEGFGAMQFTVAGVSMVVTIAAYAVKMPLAFVVGFVVITVVHEIGHAIVIRAKGLRAGVIVFIPFVGGAVTLKDQPRSAYDDAQIALAGPIAGTIASLGCLQLFKWTGRPLYLAIALAGFAINLLNLLPIGVLDGGRISAAVTKWMWLFGGAVLAYKTFKQQSPLLLLVLLLAAWQVYSSIVGEKDNKFYDVTAAQRWAVALVYFALLVFLGHQAVMVHDRLQSLRG